MGLITLAIYGVIGLLALTFVASFVVAMRGPTGRRRQVAVGTVVSFWSVLFWHFILGPANESSWRVAGQQLCESEKLRFPKTFAVDGFLDEGALIRKSSLLQLLSDRRLNFIEIAVRRKSDGTGSIAYPDGSQESEWTVPKGSSPYVRLELGRVGDPACAVLPYGLAERVDRFPFLPDTCITMSGMAQPTARHTLSLRPSALPALRRFGSWVLTDRFTGSPELSLTTADTSDFANAGQISGDTQSSSHGCLTPHTEIVNRLVGPGPLSAVQTPQVMRAERLTANADVISVNQSAKSIPLIVPEIESAAYDEDESVALFSPQVRKSDWEAAIRRAKEFGYSNYGESLLDWPNRKLIKLVPTQIENPYPWEVFAVNQGFIVLPTSPNWHDAPSSLVARYSRNGALLWAIRVTKPARAWPAWKGCARWWPQAVYTTATHLVLASRCTKLTQDQITVPGKDTSGQLWKIPLQSLPGEVD